MGQLTRRIIKCGDPEYTKKGNRFLLEVPILDLNRTSYVYLYLRHGGPPLVAATLKVDLRSSPPINKFGTFSDSVGTDFQGFVERNILPPFKEFLPCEGITASSIILEVVHIVELVCSELPNSSRGWIISPKLENPVTQRHFSRTYPSGGGFSRDSRSPYLLMECEGKFRFSWIDDNHLDAAAGH
ncbi:hypothetical protein HYT84_00480, partial [Candidatus Micrarchaeota archaeon]|nr:hypothetical protein [Candidatus Micrarchaeota archaeon]